MIMSDIENGQMVTEVRTDAVMISEIRYHRRKPCGSFQFQPNPAPLNGDATDVCRVGHQRHEMAINQIDCLH
jgi:hypothetical protein